MVDLIKNFKGPYFAINEPGLDIFQGFRFFFATRQACKDAWKKIRI
jgi:hypothetical protein